jgi:uncharacterized LabA/DUF88 family protein
MIPSPNSSGDAFLDFSDAAGARALASSDVDATGVSTTASQPPSIADELRRQVDVFIDLMELQPKICREEPNISWLNRRIAATGSR